MGMEIAYKTRNGKDVPPGDNNNIGCVIERNGCPNYDLDIEGDRIRIVLTGYFDGLDMQRLSTEMSRLGYKRDRKFGKGLEI